MIQRLKILWKLLFTKNYFIVTKNNKGFHTLNTFRGDEVTQSGKAFYLNTDSHKETLLEAAKRCQKS